MSIFKTAYDTTVGSSFVMDKTEIAIKEAIIKDYIHQIHDDIRSDLEVKPILLTNSGASETNIAYFSHPFLFEDLHKEKYICSDVRQFIKKNPNISLSDSYSIRNESEYTLAYNRLALNLIWLTQRPQTLRDFSYVPNAIFSSWISEGISNRFALDPKDQMMLAIISSFYYQTLFTEFNTFSEEERQKMATSIIKATRAPAKMVFDVTDRITNITNINDFCSQCKTILENPRIENLNAGLLITIVGNSWFGMTAKETIAVALEHPPTWIALVYSSFTERTYKKALLSRISERFTGNKGGADFTKAFANLLTEVQQSKDH